MKKPLWLAAPVVGAAALFTEELYRYTFCREGSRLLAPFLDRKGHREDYYRTRDAAAERLRERKSELMEIRSERGEILRARYYPLSGEGRRIVFIVHGYRSEHAETAGMFFECYARRGFDLFCCDHTAHGESEGRLIGFDAYECDDCLRWIDALTERFGRDVQIVLHGFSMGAATVMRMSSRCPGQVRFIVEDCGFTSAEEQLKGSFGPLYPLMRAINRAVAGYDLRLTDVRPSLALSDKPMLFVHGREDPNVPFFNGERLYGLYRGPKDSLFVDGARHMECMYVEPEAYARKLDAMIAKYMDK